MKYRPIRTKLLLFLSLIMILLVLNFMFGTLNDLRQRRMERGLIDQQQLVSEIYQTLELTQNLLEKYIKSGSTDDYKSFIKSYPVLIQKAYEFEQYPRSEEAVRHVIDFKYQIQSYTEAANTAVSYRMDNEIIPANEYFVDTIKLVLIIKNNFKNVFSVIMMDMEGIQKTAADQTRENLILNLSILMLISMICILLISNLIRTLARPIQHLTEAAQKIAEGNMEIEPVGIVANDELKIMTQAFNTMIITIKDQIDQLSHQSELEQKLLMEELSLEKMNAIVKETELKALQARINPHFLFNTLNMIKQMAFLEESEKTSSLLESLSSMLRYNLDGFHKTVTLQEELLNLDDYLKIQRLRYEDRIDFAVNAEDGLKEIKLPSLILQPLVENSITHGLKETLSDGLVSIEIYQIKQRCICSIKDNGTGMTYERQKEIIQGIKQDKNDKEQSIGIYNVYKRLKLFFLDDMDFHINSIPGQGTEILLDLPFPQNSVDREEQTV